jgi:DNA binding protein with HTH domain
MGVQVRSDSPGAWAEEIRGLPGVVAVEELGPRGSATHLRVVHRTSAFLPVFRMLQLQQRFPFTIQNGVASWVVIGAEGKIRRLLALLRRRSPGLGVVSVSHQEAPGRGPLTVRQTEIFRRAMARGYFEVPRRVTLSELAGEMQMAISSLSEALAVIERKLLVRAQELPATP